MKKPTDKKSTQASKIAPIPNRIIKASSPKREEELKSLRQKIDAEKSALMIEAKAKLKEVRSNRVELASIFASLKAEREKLGLSLASLQIMAGSWPSAILLRTFFRDLLREVYLHGFNHSPDRQRLQ